MAHFHGLWPRMMPILITNTLYKPPMGGSKRIVIRFHKSSEFLIQIRIRSLAIFDAPQLSRHGTSGWRAGETVFQERETSRNCGYITNVMSYTPSGLVAGRVSL